MEVTGGNDDRAVLVDEEKTRFLEALPLLWLAYASRDWTSMQSIKGRLRAWLIELVREAIRVEMTAQSYSWFQVKKMELKTENGVDASYPPLPPLRAQGKVKPDPLPTELSFEQIQANAIAEQEKYYEPKSD